MVALADQVAGHPLGLINPALYKMSAIGAAAGIVDVTKGNNTVSFPQGGKVHTVTGFSARPGYDLASGVGTINAAVFVPELAHLARLQARPDACWPLPQWCAWLLLMSLWSWCRPTGSTVVPMSVASSAAGAGLPSARGTPSVLVVEDDPGMATQLVRGLSRSGYSVDHVMTGREALASGDPDVVLLDLGLPDARRGGRVPPAARSGRMPAIIVVTARGEEPERVLALDAGADDYLVKPFGLAELLARIRAVLRRVQPGGGVLRHGPLAVDLRTRKVTVARPRGGADPQGVRHPGVPGRDPGRVMTRQEILESAWDAHWYGPTKVLDVHVAALRRKLGVPGLIETAYGKGFRLGGL